MASADYNYVVARLQEQPFRSEDKNSHSGVKTRTAIQE